MPIVTVPSLALVVGQSQQLQVWPPGVTWRSTAPAVATVNESGTVTAVAEGTASIVARRVVAGGPTVVTSTTTIPVTVTPGETPDPPDPPDPPVTDLAPLVAPDLTLAGQQNVDLQYANVTMALRYVRLPDGTDERRFLFYAFDSWQPNCVGDLIEYRLHPAGLKQGDAHWTWGNVPDVQEVRRWKGWHTRQRMLDGSYPNAQNIFGGNGAWPASFYVDEATGRLWYTWQPQYPGGAIVWPAYSAVTLDDSEAIVVGDDSTEGRTVSDAHIHGPYYFRDPSEVDDFKQAACGFIAIPPERQAAMGGRFLAVGHHSANVGSRGPRGLGFWRITDLPATPPPAGATLWPGDASLLLYDTSPLTGAQPICNMKLPNVQFQACGHASQGTQFSFSAAGATPVAVGAGGSAGTTVDDAIYQHDYGAIDCLTIYMTTPAAGGAFVPEIWNGVAWVQPEGWSVGAGAADLSAPANTFSWPQVFIPDTDIDGSAPIEPGTYVRLRRTSSGIVGGTIKAVVTTTSLATGNEYADRPLGEGGYAPLGSEQYDASHYSYAYEEMFWGGGWVRTDTVEGLAYFGPIRAGGMWYGAAPAFMQPVGGGAPVERQYYAAAESWSNGGKSEGPGYPFFWTFSAQQLLELAAGTRERNGNGFQPQAFTRIPDQWPGVIYSGTVNNPASPYAGEIAFNLYGYGHCVQYDRRARELVCWMSCASVYTGKPMLTFFAVR